MAMCRSAVYLVGQYGQLVVYSLVDRKPEYYFVEF